MYYAGVAETIGVSVNVLTPEQLKEIWPLCETDGHPRRHPASRRRLHPACRPDPGAGQGRAGRRRRDQPQHHGHGDRADAGGEWLVKTDKGDITCEHVVSATGNFVRQTGAMLGHRHSGHPGRAPVHRHRAASRNPGAAEDRACRRWACCARRIPPGTCARRRAGCCSAPTRRARRVCYVDGPAEEAEYELFQEDLDRLDAAYRDGDRARAGVRRGRHQEGLQRRHRLYAGRVADRRAGLGPAERLAQRGPFLRRDGGGRRRLAARRMDRRRASPRST